MTGGIVTQATAAQIKHGRFIQLSDRGAMAGNHLIGFDNEFRFRVHFRPLGTKQIGIALMGLALIDPGLGQVAMDRFQRKLAQGQLRTRLYAMTDGAGETLDWLCANGPLEDPEGFLFMRATKLYGDGALGSRGAALLEDYSDDPGNRGLLFLEEQEMQAQVDKVLECGFQVAVHAIGDRGNRVVLDAMAAAMAAHPENPGRHRVEHAQLVAPEDRSVP